MGNYTKYHGTQYIDELTTAERSIENSKKLKTIETLVDQIGDIVRPEENLFGDGSSVSTQETRAEDIVSVEDIRLQSEIDLKVDTTTFEDSQAVQDSKLDTLENSLNQTNLDLGDLTDRVDNNDSNISDIQNTLTALEAVDVALIAADVVINNKVNSNTDRNDQQDGRLTILETSIAGAQRDYSTMSDSGLVDTTVKVITPTIKRDFNVDYDIATNVINPTTLELTTIVNYASTVTADFYFNATQGTGQLVDMTVELYNLTKGTVIDKAVSTMDFAGTINFESGSRTNIGEVDAGDQIQVRVYTDVGSVTINNSGLNLKIETLQGISTATYDYDITSTSVWGTANTQTDLNAIYNRTVVNEEIVSDLTEVVDGKVDAIVSTDGLRSSVLDNTGNKVQISAKVNDVADVSLDTPKEVGLRVETIEYPASSGTYRAQMALFEYGIDGVYSKYQPTSNFSPTTKQYVDDKVNTKFDSESIGATQATTIFRGSDSKTINIEHYRTDGIADEDGNSSIQLLIGEYGSKNWEQIILRAGKLDGSAGTYVPHNGNSITNKTYVDNKIQVGNGNEDGILYLIE